MSNINRREILKYLHTSELRELAEQFDLPIKKDDEKAHIVEALATTEVATLGEMLMSMSRKRLKELCRARGLDDSGREKMLIATRLLGLNPMAPPAPKAVPPIRRRRKDPSDS